MHGEHHAVSIRKFQKGNRLINGLTNPPPLAAMACNARSETAEMHGVTIKPFRGDNPE
jgi:hypothetical protein